MAISAKPTSGQRRRQFVPAGIRSGLPVIRSLFSELDLGKKSPNHRINHFWLYCGVLEQTLNLDRVGDLLKLQKAAQKISPILDLDQLVDKVVNEVARPSGVWILTSTCTMKSAANCEYVPLLFQRA